MAGHGDEQKAGTPNQRENAEVDQPGARRFGHGYSLSGGR